MGKGADGGPPGIVRLRQDLRLQDHLALEAALASGRAVVPVCMLDDDSPGAWALGGAARWRLHHGFASLAESLVARATARRAA